jgi:nucleotide-binding universal stress UspA family protein
MRTARTWGAAATGRCGRAPEGDRREPAKVSKSATRGVAPPMQSHDNGPARMAKRILVPLDRSSAAEQLLSLVGHAARTAGAALRLLHVAPVPGNVQTPQGRVVAYADQQMDRIEAEQTEYLQALAAAHLGGVMADCRVRFGEPAEEILKEIETFDADLVAVATETRSSISRALLGSVAEELLSEAPDEIVAAKVAAA